MKDYGNKNLFEWKIKCDNITVSEGKADKINELDNVFDRLKKKFE